MYITHLPLFDELISFSFMKSPFILWHLPVYLWHIPFFYEALPSLMTYMTAYTVIWSFLDEPVLPLWNDNLSYIKTKRKKKKRRHLLPFETAFPVGQFTWGASVECFPVHGCILPTDIPLILLWCNMCWKTCRTTLCLLLLDLQSVSCKKNTSIQPLVI